MDDVLKNHVEHYTRLYVELHGKNKVTVDDISKDVLRHLVNPNCMDGQVKFMILSELKKY